MAAEIGVISDTHGLLREEALAQFAGVQLIIHAGDVGSPAILERLSTIAPVEAIRGNVDVEPWAADLPETRTVEIEQAKIYVIHNAADLNFDPARRGYSAVISGHSHKTRSEVLNDVLYLNPGSAGPQRFRLPATLARLTVDAGQMRARIITLTTGVR